MEEEPKEYYYDESNIRWCWYCNDRNVFVPYRKQDSEMIEKEFLRDREKNFRLPSGYIINFKGMVQISSTTGYQRAIIRGERFTFHPLHQWVLDETVYNPSEGKLPPPKGFPKRVPDPPYLVVLKDKRVLLNPLQKGNPSTLWQHQPYTEVHIQGSNRGYTQGWEMLNKRTKTGRLIVHDHAKNTKVAIPPEELVPIPGEIRAPWYHSKVSVFRVPKPNFRNLLKHKQIAGLSITYMDVFEALFERGIPAYVMGGAVRDFVAGKPLEKIKDIDFSFGCSADELAAIAKQKSWKFSCNSNGLVQIGNSGTLCLEGKSIGFYNYDYISWRKDTLCSIGCDLQYEAIYRDFAVNALLYDPINDCIIDPTSRGVQDCLDKALSLPVETEEEVEMWARGNPTKVLRYWKMKSKGYHKNVDLEEKLKGLVPNIEQKEWLRAYYALVNGGKGVEEWIEALVKDLGAEIVYKMLNLKKQ